MEVQEKKEDFDFDDYFKERINNRIQAGGKKQKNYLKLTSSKANAFLNEIIPKKKLIALAKSRKYIKKMKYDQEKYALNHVTNELRHFFIQANKLEHLNPESFGFLTSKPSRNNLLIKGLVEHLRDDIKRDPIDEDYKR